MTSRTTETRRHDTCILQTFTGEYIVNFDFRFMIVNMEKQHGF